MSDLDLIAKPDDLRRIVDALAENYGAQFAAEAKQLVDAVSGNPPDISPSVVAQQLEQLVKRDLDWENRDDEVLAKQLRRLANAPACV